MARYGLGVCIKCGRWFDEAPCKRCKCKVLSPVQCVLFDDDLQMNAMKSVIDYIISLEDRIEVLEEQIQ